MQEDNSLEQHGGHLKWKVRFRFDDNYGPLELGI
jgi:hypothetical protein